MALDITGDSLMNLLTGRVEVVEQLEDTLLVALLLEQVVELGHRNAPKQLTLPTSHLSIGEEGDQSHGLARVHGCLDVGVLGVGHGLLQERLVS